MQIPTSVQRSYGSTDPLKVRIETHELYEERLIDLNDAVSSLLSLHGDESLLDIGCGPGRWLHYLRQHGHTGQLVGLDQSPAMIAEANALEQSATWLVGEANILPFDAGAFDILTARHMLYHVPDIGGALREFRRVAPRVLLTTNSRLSLPRIFELTADLCAHFSLPEQPLASKETFWTETALEYLTPAFTTVAPVIIPNALVFTTPEPIVRYIASIIPSLDLPDRDGLMAEMLTWLTAEAGRRLDQLGGTWRDPKDVGLYLCGGG